ncbi:VWA domain-containing protein [Ramlibacter sp. USB13]|uniref:VWA domain-containing protein n=1 Tax=Ramlibacter cellulosilyticus TaxID=2764187 RepID=A0A923MQT4_9BURK|nr:VWA domain-containing protein [Ramlibacter cellulosilyticus]MBC5783518.1 VWA domain-containing protein [Ramlibacter cellulosilyticus]
MLNLAPLPLEARASERLAGFPGFLHANGFALGAGDAVEVLRTAALVGVLDPRLLRWSLQALLCGRADEWRRFDALFDAWFLPANRWAAPQRRSVEVGAGVPSPRGGEGGRRAGEGASPRDAASPAESLASADFRELHEGEQLLEIEALMRRFARRLRHVQLRREARARRGHRLALAPTIRRSIASGGTPFHLCWKAPRRVRPRLVLLLDVSRSMAAYSFFYLRLARALSGELADVHTFIFHTRVTAVSDALRDPDPWRAQERLHLLAQGWGGGTRIGESLAQFNREHARRLVHARTAVLVLSDGYDTGEPEQLATALAALRRRARRIVWLNPLAALPGYAPLARGMQAALPYLDLHAPGASLAAIEAVLPELLEALR